MGWSFWFDGRLVEHIYSLRGLACGDDGRSYMRVFMLLLGKRCQVVILEAWMVQVIFRNMRVYFLGRRGQSLSRNWFGESSSAIPRPKPPRCTSFVLASNSSLLL